MIKKTLRNAAVGTLAAGAMILPAATTIAPQMQLVACNYPDSIVTNTDIVAPSVTRARTNNVATINVDAGGKKPNGQIRFKSPGQKAKFAKIRKGGTVSFNFGKNFKANRTYKLRAKFFGNCKFRNSSEQMVITVFPR